MDEKRNPQSIYGHSKAEAEIELLEILPTCCIVRTSWVFGMGGRCFPDTILRLAANRPRSMSSMISADVNVRRGSGARDHPAMQSVPVELCM